MIKLGAITVHAYKHIFISIMQDALSVDPNLISLLTIKIVNLVNFWRECFLLHRIEQMKMESTRVTTCELDGALKNLGMCVEDIGPSRYHGDKWTPHSGHIFTIEVLSILLIYSFIAIYRPRLFIAPFKTSSS
jgi:hypothetical protein